MFIENEKLQQTFTSQDHSSIACKSTYDICKTADYFLKLDVLKGQFPINLICQSIFASLNTENLYENTDFKLHGHNKMSLIKKIVLRYIHYKGRTLSKSIIDIKKYQDEMQKRRETSDGNK